MELHLIYIAVSTDLVTEKMLYTVRQEIFILNLQVLVLIEMMKHHTKTS